MKLTIFFATVLSAFLLSACTSNFLTKEFKKDEFYLKALQKTKKVDIVENNQIKNIYTATYLNKVDKKYDDKYENFIVSVFNTKTSPSSDLNITLNEKNYINYQELDKNLAIVKNIPLKNNWAKYYFIKFEKQDDKNSLTLIFSNQDNQEAQLKF